MTTRASRNKRPRSKKQPAARRRTGAPTRRSRFGRLEWILLAAAAILGAVLWWASAGEPSAPEGAAFVGGDFHSLVVDPTRPDTVYVGGHEAVSRSTDAGATWHRVDTLDDADAMGWGFTDDAVLVSGHPGLSIAAAGPGEFSRRNDGLPHTDLHALGAGGGTVYAAGPGAGVVASTDGGATWRTRTTDAGRGFFGRILVDDDGDTLTAADTGAGPVRSTDGGRTWTPLGGPPSLWLTRTGEVIIASGGPNGAFRWEPDHDTWEPMAVPDGAQLVEADPHTPGRLFAGGHSGTTVELWVSTDNGDTWERT